MDAADPDRTEVFIRLLTEQERNLGRYAMTLVPSAPDADDILQEAKVVMWRTFDRFELGTSSEAWGRRIVFRQVLKFRRQPARRVQPLSEQTLELVAVEFATSEEHLDKRILALSGCVSKLSGEHRCILQLRYHEELSIDRIAEQLGRTSGAVYRVLSRIRCALHECVSNSTQLEAKS